MKDLKVFLEHRTVNEIKIKCSQTGEEINPEYTVYDETSLNSIISRYKQNKDQFNDLHIFLCEQKGNSWIAQTKVEYTIDLGRMSDKFLSSDKDNYSFDDILSMLENENSMLIFVK